MELELFDPETFPGDRRAVARFRRLVLGHYARNRRSFPWRETADPWAILVSEVMLQQTQTERVVPKYEAFLAAFPGPASLAAAGVEELLRLWQGLGYNRRALALKRAAEAMVASHGGKVPRTEEELLSLPGVGPYTARAVLAFAFGEGKALVETNVRSVFLLHFFPGEGGVSDSRILALAEAALDRKDPRNWYYALMDYGAFLKRGHGNPNSRSASYARQTPFATSHRRVRGAVLRELSGPPGGARGGAAASGAAPAGELGLDELCARIPFARERVEKAVAELVAEGFVEYGGTGIRFRRG